jgi:NOL1/NOP2/fmu family ribosome biogenesis protein
LNKNNFTAEELTLSQALHFLKKEEIKPQGISQYLIATHQNIPLGFLKKAGNRYNNLYPKEWRIRMDIPAHINSGTLVAL